MDHAMNENDDRGEKQQKRRRLPAEQDQDEDDKSHGDDDDEEYDDDDDRKPPAREVVVRRPQSPASHLMSHDSTDESMASSVLTPHAAPASPFLPLTSKKVGQKAAAAAAGSCYEDPGLTVSLSHEDYQEQEQLLRTRIMALSGSSLFFMAYFLYVVLPAAALASLVAIAVTSALAATEAARYARIEYRDRLEHRGFGELLPPWLYQMLTQRSLHEFLMNFHQPGEHQNRNRHLLLYFLPGLTIEQRTAYIQRLPVRHRRMLEQPGLGQFMGPNFMSFLLGRDQFQEHERQRAEATGGAATGGRRGTTPRHRPDPRIQVIEEEERPRLMEERRAIENAVPATRLQFDDDSSASSDLGLDITANDLAGGMTEEQARNVARDLRIRDNDSAMVNRAVAEFATNVVPEDDDDEESEEEEEPQELEEAEMRIIIEAALATMWRQQERVARTMIANTSAFISRTTRQLASSFASRGSRFALYTGGIGLVGVVTTAVVARGGRRGFMSSMMQDLLSPAVGERSSVSSLLVLGGAGAATVLYTTHRMLQLSLRHSNRKDDSKKKKKRTATSSSSPQSK